MQRNIQSAGCGKKDKVDLAAQNFLEFLAEGRKVILEDVALLQDRYPRNRLFKLPYFKMPADGSPGSPLQQKWAAFKAEVIAAHARSIDENLQVFLQHLPMHSALYMLIKQSAVEQCTLCGISTAILCKQHAHIIRL